MVTKLAVAMKTYISTIARNKFVRNVAVLMSGTAASQLIAFIFVPLITRIYGPESFGLLGVFTSLLMVLIPVTALTYPIAIVLPKHDYEARALTKLSFLITIITTTCALIILIFLGNPILELINAQSIANFIFLIPLGMVFGASLQIAEQWSVRTEQFSLMAKAAVAQSFVLNSLKSGVGLFCPTALTLIFTTVFGSLLHAGILWGGRCKRKGKAADKEVSCSILNVARRYCDFPAYRAPQVFINAASQSLPILMLASFFGASSAGFYVLARTVMMLPSQLIGKAVGDVFYPRITQAAINNENASRLIIKATIMLGLVGLLPFSLIVIWGDQLFSLVFGSQWGVSGEYARWLSLMLFMNLINRPSVAAIPVLGLQRGLIVYELFSTGSKILVMYWALTVLNNDLLAVALFSIFGAIAYIVLILWVLLYAHNANAEKSNVSKTS